MKRQNTTINTLMAVAIALTLSQSALANGHVIIKGGTYVGNGYLPEKVSQYSGVAVGSGLALRSAFVGNG